MTNNMCVVVGGGVVGLLAAYLAKQKFDRVVLVESSKNLGGLLGSFDIEGATYDYGTHFASLTHIEDLNNILFGSADERKAAYNYFPYLRTENYFNGRWHLTSSLINTKNLPSDEYAQGVIELLEAPGTEDDETNLYRYLIATFGETFTEKVYRPVLKKLLDTDLEEINKDILSVFGLLRLIALTPEATNQLKTICNYDNSLGYHSYKDGDPNHSYCYPKGDVGIGYWSSYLLKKVKSLGVDIVTENTVTNIEHRDSLITSVTLSDERKIECDHVLWTPPPALALMAADIEFNSKLPSFRTYTLCHFEFEKAFTKTIPQFLYCWDASMLTYRVTLYPNINEGRACFGRHNLTIEVLSDKTAENRTDEIQSIVLDELRIMKIVSDDNLLLHSKVQYMGNSFPVITTEFLESSKNIQQLVNSHFNNMTLLGRSAGATFSVNDLLIETYEKMKELEVASG
ncbi:FAD-dependent oxidoreductase [Nitrosomonadales bacterium]|nr:FAD-dependent oxidoreductase [Nitrosomonadales bacterium]